MKITKLMKVQVLSAAAILLAVAPSYADVVVGVSTSLTGPRALQGKYTTQGVDLALEEINAAGGLLGGVMSTVVEDDQGDNPNSALNSMSKMKEVHKVPVVEGPHYTVAQLAVQKMYCDGSLISITGAAGAGVTGNGCKYVFRVRGNDAFLAQTFVNFVLGDLKATKIGVITANDDFGRGAQQKLLTALAKVDVKPVAVEIHNAGDTDFSAQLSSLKTAGAEYVIVWSHDNESALIVRQARQFGLPFKFVGPSAMSSPTFIQLAGPAAEGVISTTEFLTDSTEGPVKSFVDAYTKKYNETPEIYAAAYYDAIKLTAAAIQKAGSTDVDKIRDALSGMTMQGVLTNYRCDENGDCNHLANFIEIKNGKPSFIKALEF